MNSRFKFRCWVNKEFPTMTYTFINNINCLHSIEVREYYIYSSTIFNDRILTNINDIKAACGLDEKDFNIYFDYINRNKIDIHGQIWLDGIIEQCTGLTDKNDKLVYEGDILEDDYERYVVKWDERSSGFYGYKDDETHFMLSDYFIKKCIIIGNIHENNELLGEKNEQQ